MYTVTGYDQHQAVRFIKQWSPNDPFTAPIIREDYTLTKVVISDPDGGCMSIDVGPAPLFVPASHNLHLFLPFMDGTKTETENISVPSVLDSCWWCGSQNREQLPVCSQCGKDITA